MRNDAEIKPNINKPSTEGVNKLPATHQVIR